VNLRIARQVRLVGFAFVVNLWGCSASNINSQASFHSDEDFSGAPEAARPWTHLKFLNDPDDFQFSIITDRTGGHRPGVFPAILKKVNLLRPEFVMSVGDYIEGYVTDKQVLSSEWREIDDMVDQLEAPLFFVVGNHDVANDESAELWKERSGRAYYHFLYKNVLFIALSTEDPPPALAPELEKDWLINLELYKAQGGDVAMERAKTIPGLYEYAQSIFLPAISDTQRDWATGVVDSHPDVRWTFVFLHKPAWEYDNANFALIEKALEGRGYTVLAGHKHDYKHTVRQGQDYMRLATTGGDMGDPATSDSMDHITWVSMSDEGPVFAHLVATGILAKDDIPAFIPGAEFCGEYYNITCVYGESNRPVPVN
jgi:serine/threonine-protein phosphatase CPPED1